jgi:WXXGXW repeat (2 copies)
MTNPIRRTAVGISTVVGAALIATSALAQVTVVVPTAPPPPRVEVMPAPPRGGVVWQPGYYKWSGREHVWVEGRYADPPRPGVRWVAPTWDHRDNGWVYLDGRWG